MTRLLFGGLILAVLGCALAVTVGGVAVWRATHPPRSVDADPSLTVAGLPIETVSFRAVDGVALEGWLLRGPAGAPAVLLAHDFGRSKDSLANLARATHEAGFSVMVFDFRGHGDSDGGGSTFGVAEKRDVAGAIDALRRLTGRTDAPIGIYGEGMGAHAAVLAAADRPELRVLVLDGLYPDAGWALGRRLWGRWQPAAAAERVPLGLFAAMNHVAPERDAAAGTLGGLRDRELLLLAPSADPELTAAIRAMYDSIPVRRDLERSYEVLPSVRGGSRYGADRDRHARTVIGFFRARLAPR